MICVMLGIPLNYERVERQLASADIELGAGEVHGVLCGLICSGHTDARACWYGEVFADHSEGGLLEQECRASLDQLCSETEEQSVVPVWVSPLFCLMMMLPATADHCCQ